MADELSTQPVNPGADSSNTNETDPNQSLLAVTLKTLIADHVTADVSREKTYSYAAARKCELYWRGTQYVYPVLLGGVTADYSPISGTVDYNMSPEDRETQYDYVLNVIRGDGRKFVAVLGQRGPNVKAMSRRVDDDATVRRARKADTAAEYLRSYWDPERIQRHLALSLWKDGTTFFYTPWVADAEKYGTIDVPIIESVPTPIGEQFFVCPECGSETPASAAGQPPTCMNPICRLPLDPSTLQDARTMNVPRVAGTKTYPKGCVECHLGTVYDVTTPFYGKLIKDLPWLWYEYEEHSSKLLAAFQQLREKLGDQEWQGDSDGVSAQGRLARDTASSPTGTFITPRKNRWLYTRIWLRPSMFQLIKDDAMRTALMNQYKTGVKVTLVQGEVVQLQEERMDDVWSMCKPDTSEYIYADPICWDYLQIQDIINDMYNIIVETLERSIPYLLADPLVLDVIQLNKQRGKPGQVIPAKAGVGQQLANSIVKGPVAQTDPDTFKWIDMVHESGRENAGILPAVFGGGDPASTARAAELQRNQALQQLNTVWNEMRSGWAGAYYNAVRQLALHSLPDGSNLANNEAQSGDFSELLGGGFYFETEESIPMTWGQKRDQIMFLLQAGPEAWKLFGLEHPLNVQEFHDVMGMAGWKIPNIDARDKVMGTIKMLLQGKATTPPPPPPPMVPPGMPPPPPPPPPSPQPSIPPDVFEDDHMFVVSVIKEWAQTEEARAAREVNPDGYANVIAYGTASIQLAGPLPGAGPGPGPQAPPPPMPPGGPPQPNLPGQPSGVATPAPPGSQLGGAPIASGPGAPGGVPPG